MIVSHFDTLHTWRVWRGIINEKECTHQMVHFALRKRYYHTKNDFLLSTLYNFAVHYELILDLFDI